MNSCELTAAITALANTIAKNCSDDDLEILGVVFTQLGDTITTISVTRAKCNNKNSYLNSGKRENG